MQYTLYNPVDWSHKSPFPAVGDKCLDPYRYIDIIDYYFNTLYT